MGATWESCVTWSLAYQFTGGIFGREDAFGENDHPVKPTFGGLYGAEGCCQDWY